MKKGEETKDEKIRETVKTHRLNSRHIDLIVIGDIVRKVLQGMGDTVIPMISGIVELVMRIAAALALPLVMGESGIYYAEILAWLGAAVLLAAAYYRRMRTLEIPPGMSATLDS